MGGITNLDDALQFFLAGARAVAVGSASFINPYTIPRLISDLQLFMESEGLQSWDEIVGAAQR